MAESLSPSGAFCPPCFGGPKGDRPPSEIRPTSLPLSLMEKTGIFFPQAHLDPRQMAELAAAGHEILGFDAIMPEFSVQQEGRRSGASKMDWEAPP